MFPVQTPDYGVSPPPNNPIDNAPCGMTSTVPSPLILIALTALPEVFTSSESVAAGMLPAEFSVVVHEALALFAFKSEVPMPLVQM